MKMRFDSQLSLMNCQTFSTGFDSGALDGRNNSVMLVGTLKLRRGGPPSPIENESGMSAGVDGEADFLQIIERRLA